MKVNNKTILIGVGVLVALGVIYYLSGVVIPRALVSWTKAAPASKVSMENSLIIGERLLASPDGVDKCKVNVFVLDASGKGVSGKNVVMEGAPEMKPKGNNLSDSEGKVAYEIVSTETKQYTIKASIEGMELNNSVRCTFRD